MLDLDVGASAPAFAGLEVHTGSYWSEGRSEGWAPVLDVLVAWGLAERDRAEAAIGLPGSRGPDGPLFGISHAKVGADAAGLRPAKLYLGIDRAHAAVRAACRAGGGSRVSTSERSTVAAPQLALAPGVRFFSWNDRTQVHVSAVPLPFVSLGDALARALSSLEGGRTLDAVADEAGVAPGEPRAALERFFGRAHARRRPPRSRAARSDPRAAPGQPAPSEPVPLSDEPVQPRLRLLLRVVRPRGRPAARGG